MINLDTTKLFVADDIMRIQNNLLQGVLGCRTMEAVEACTTYARFLSKTGLTGENYPLFIELLEVGNHWVIDGLIGDRDPFLFFSSIQPNHEIMQACFGLLTERHPGGIYTKSLSVVLGVLQAAYNVSEDGYNIYPLTISDVNALGKHLDEEIGQEDSLNRCILDILEKITQLKGMTEAERAKEELAIHANDIRSFFFDDSKSVTSVIPRVLLVRMNYRDFEVSPRKEIAFSQSKLSGEGEQTSEEMDEQEEVNAEMSEQEEEKTEKASGAKQTKPKKRSSKGNK